MTPAPDAPDGQGAPGALPWVDEPSVLAWLGPAHRASPAEALLRIQLICNLHADLFSALFTVLATHQPVPREVLSAALKQFRPDLDPYSRDDVQSLLAAIWHGGRSGFEAVLRTRASSPRKGGGLSWVKE